MRVSVPEFSVDKTETSPVSGEGSMGQLPFRYYGSPEIPPQQAMEEMGGGFADM